MTENAVMTWPEVTSTALLFLIGLALLYAVISAGVELWRAVRRMMQ